MLLVRLYPRAWRARYGEELEALVLEASAGGGVPWRTRFDVVRGALRERLHAAPGGGAPTERVRASASLVLWGWAAFVVAGIGVQKFSEHWQSATPSASREVPAAAFDTLVAAAALGSLLVLGGVAAAGPSIVRLLAAGGWPRIRRPITLAAALTAVLVPATIGLALWADRLSDAQRNGHDAAYGAVGGLWALLAVAALVAWTRAATLAAARLELPAATLRLEARLAGGVAATMAVMTAATAVWWGSLATAAPWFLAGAPAGTASSPLAPQLLAAALLMLLATVTAAAAAARAVRTLPLLRNE